MFFLSSIEEDKVPISESHQPPHPQGRPVYKNYDGQLNVIIIINSTNSDICMVHNVSQHDNNFICLYDLYKGKIKLNSII